MASKDPDKLDLTHYSTLIVDDNATNLRVIGDYLKQEGFRVLTARNGETGIKRALRAQPDIILLDVMLPGIDGFETCRRLKADALTQDIPVIFMTALDETAHKLRGFEVGAVDYVTKPFQQEEVLVRITTHLRIQEQRRRLQRMTADLEQANAQISRFNQELEQTVQQRTEELHQAYRVLERLNKTKSDFIEVISHELRTPLTLIRGYTELLETQLTQKKDPQATRLLAGSLTGVARMYETVNNMLDVTRIDTQTLVLSRDTIVLWDIIRRIQISLQEALQERRLSLTVDSELSNLPFIHADPDLLHKVFYHLIINAVKYTPDGGSIRVSGKVISPDGDEPAVEIVVSDNGIGIDPAHHELIFEKFYQTGEVSSHSSGRTKFKGGGPGLGLAIVQGIVLAHGGKVWVESEGYDEVRCPGSHFHVLLPVKSQDASPLANIDPDVIARFSENMVGGR